MDEATKPVALVTVFGARVLDRILAAIASGPQPPIADWYIGSYGINADQAARIKRVRGCHYAPVFGIQPGMSKARMQRPMARRRFGEAADTVHVGRFPPAVQSAYFPRAIAASGAPNSGSASATSYEPPACERGSRSMPGNSTSYFRSA